MRREVAFSSGGAKCAAWLYCPTETSGKVPCVVMAHGFSLTRHDGLMLYAEAFARAGVAVLVYDHRFVGDSEGKPRQLMHPVDQLEDRQAAVAFARTLDGIDAERITVWGYSLGAVSAIDAAVADPSIAGVILLCPALDFRWRVNRDLWAAPRNTIWLIGQSIKDALGGNVMIPVTAEPGGRGVMTAPGELDGFLAAVAPESPWRNETKAGPMVAIALTRLVGRARKLNRPILVQAGQRDISVSSRAIDHFGQRASNAVVKRYDVDHFQPFYDGHHAQIAADQVAWLARCPG